jgi:transcriptional regulator with XRE-family HTH domain
VIRTPTPIADALLAFEVPSFGELVYEVRRKRCKSQQAVAGAAGLSTAYWSSIENGRRLAPPRETAAKIALALALSHLETTHLLAIAESERAAALHDSRLPVSVRQVMALLRLHAHRLPISALEGIRAELSRYQQGALHEGP